MWKVRPEVARCSLIATNARAAIAPGPTLGSARWAKLTRLWRPVRLRGTESRHHAVRKSHAEIGFLSGLRPPFITVSGSEKSYRPRKVEMAPDQWEEVDDVVVADIHAAVATPSMVRGWSVRSVHMDQCTLGAFGSAYCADPRQGTARMPCPFTVTHSECNHNREIGCERAPFRCKSFPPQRWVQLWITLMHRGDISEQAVVSGVCLV